MIDPRHIHTIHNEQRRCIIQCTDTTYHDTASGSGITTLWNDIHTGNLTLQCLADICITLCIQFFCTYICHRTCQVRFLLCTVTNYDHFIQRFRIFQQYDTNILLIAYSNFFCQISYVWYIQNRLWIRFNCEMSVYICDRTICSSFNYNICTDNRVTVHIYNRTGYVFSLLLYRKRVLCVFCQYDMCPFHSVTNSHVFQQII